MVENGSISIQRIREVCHVAPEEDTGASEGSSKLSPKDSWPSKGSVVFQDVSLKYRWVLASRCTPGVNCFAEKISSQLFVI